MISKPPDVSIRLEITLGGHPVAAVDVERGAGHFARIVGQQEVHCLGAIGIGRDVAHRNFGCALLAEGFALPSASQPDVRLVTGAVLFGIGWGLAGFCPGPALVAALTGGVPALIFLVAMLAGMALARWLATDIRPAQPRRAS